MASLGRGGGGADVHLAHVAGLNLRRLLTFGLRYDNGWQIA